MSALPVIEIDGNRIVVTQTYISALGLVCTQIQNIDNQTQAYCFENDQWQALPELN